MPTSSDLAWHLLCAERLGQRITFDGDEQPQRESFSFRLLGDPVFAAVVLGIARINDEFGHGATSANLTDLGLPLSAVRKTLNRLKTNPASGGGAQVSFEKQGRSFAFWIQPAL